jgi:hypothetical protein
VLRAWSDAPAIILSCPGPLRRHHAAVLPVAALALPQCLLGGEAQLQAFAASVPDLAPRLFFSPLPELFSSPDSMAALLAATRAPVFDPPTFDLGARPVHLRFGGTRSARVLKDARNGLVLAEDHTAPPISASRHPFADGLTLPAQMRRLFTYDAGAARPVAVGGGAIPVTLLDTGSVAADLPPAEMPGRAAKAPQGLEIVSAAEFRSGAWAAGPVRAGSAHLLAAMQQAAQDGAPFVILPWNLDHPGSTVPALVERTLRLQPPGSPPTVRLLVLPFNYPGQTGLIRRLIRQMRDKTDAPEHAVQNLFIGRLNHLNALPDLRALATIAWVDGNDPEHDWTSRRLAACGIKPILLAAGSAAAALGITSVPADEALTISAETRFGLLHFATHLPSLRALRHVLSLTAELAAADTSALAGSRPAKPNTRQAAGRRGARA